jgi:circadian clock protein KaiC
MDKITSGIEGFDKLLFGGLPKGRAYLVAGEPGTGKTIFTLQFLLEGIRNGEKAVYISIDEKPEHVILDAQSLGWDIQKNLDDGRLKIIDVTTYFSPSHFTSDSGIDIHQIMHDILGYVKESGATRLAIDPISPLIFAEKNIPEVSEYIRRLIFAVEDTTNCTTLLTSYVPVGTQLVSQHGIEEFAASGIILLKLTKINQKYIRSIWVRKIRGTRIDLSEYSYEILPERGIVLRQPL